MSTIHVNLADMDKAAHSFKQSSDALAQEIRKIRSAIQVLSSLRTGKVDGIRARMDQVCKTLTQQAETLSGGERDLRKLAADLRAATGGR